MEFSKEFLQNGIFTEQALKFNPLDPERIPGLEPQNTGAEILSDGSVHFRIHAPESKSVLIRCDGRELPLIKGENGMFEGVLPYDPAHCGPLLVDVVFDGQVLVYPRMQIHWNMHKPRNFVEFPDPGLEFCHIKDVPHGAMCREIYWSKELGRWQRCLVYTPPGYMRGTESYPVLYLQHGNSEDETVWEHTGRIAHIMDNLLAEGKAVPMLIVLNDSMVRYRPLPPGPPRDPAFFDSLLGSCIPHIEQNYRALSDRRRRSIAGTSLGSYHALYLTMNHPEVFSSCGILSGEIELRPIDKETCTDKICDREFVEKSFDLIYRTLGEKEDDLQKFLAEEEMLKEAGTYDLACYRSKVYPGQGHLFGCWRRAVYDYLQMLFRW